MLSSNKNIIDGEFKSFIYNIELNALHEKLSAPLDLVPYITRIEYPMRYDEHVFPYLIVEMTLDRMVYTLLQEYYRDIKYVFTLKKQSWVEDRSFSKLEDVYKEKSLVSLENDDFDPLPDENNPEGRSLSQRFRAVLHLFDKECLEMNKEIINASYKNTKIEELLNVLVSKYSKKNPYITKPDNTEKYDNIFIPPLFFSSVVKYLQLYYGIYDSGLIFYSDFNNLWISNYKPFTNNEKFGKTLIQILDASQAEGALKSTFKDEASKSYILRTEIPPVMEINDVSQKEVYGSKVKIGWSSKEKIINIEEGIGDGGIKSKENSKETTRTYWNKTSHNRCIESFVRDLNESLEVVIVNVSAIDLNALPPDNEYTIKRSHDLSNEVSGNYRLKSLTHRFTKDSASLDWFLSTTCKFVHR